MGADFSVLFVELVYLWRVYSVRILRREGNGRRVVPMPHCSALLPSLLSFSRLSQSIHRGRYLGRGNAAPRRIR